jgi:hypothetical protein
MEFFGNQDDPLTLVQIFWLTIDKILDFDLRIVAIRKKIFSKKLINLIPRETRAERSIFNRLPFNIRSGVISFQFNYNQCSIFIHCKQIETAARRKDQFLSNNSVRARQVFQVCLQSTLVGQIVLLG